MLKLHQTGYQNDNKLINIESMLKINFKLDVLHKPGKPGTVQMAD